MVTVTVENGTGVAGANSYVSLVDWKSYADQMGWDYSGYDDDQISSSLIRAAQAIDARYLNRFPGVQTYEASQSMQWPRKAGYVSNLGTFVANYPTTIRLAGGWMVSVTTVPALLIKAQNEAAWREIQEPGTLFPDLERGGGIKALSAGSVSITYADGAPSGTTYPAIEALMDALLGSQNGLTARAIRV